MLGVGSCISPRLVSIAPGKLDGCCSQKVIVHGLKGLLAPVPQTPLSSLSLKKLGNMSNKDVDLWSPGGSRQLSIGLCKVGDLLFVVWEELLS